MDSLLPLTFYNLFVGVFYSFEILHAQLMKWHSWLDKVSFKHGDERVLPMFHFFGALFWYLFYKFDKRMKQVYGLFIIAIILIFELF